MHDLELYVGFSLIGNHRTVLEVELVSFQDDKWFVFDCELDGETPISQISMLMKSIIAVKV